MKILLKWIAICLDVSLIVTVLGLFSANGVPSKAADIFLAALFIAAPISSLAAVLFPPEGGEGWLGLYLKRKTLEEKDKIEKLRSQQNRTGTSNKD